ncbi:hypothetical protein Tco_0353664 [Tanacetum coccineum]
MKDYGENERDDNLFVNLDDGKDNFESVNKNSESKRSGHSKYSVLPRTGGYILNLMEEVMKVGQTMGYNMDGCIKDITEIIESQGDIGLIDVFYVIDVQRPRPKAKKDWVKGLLIRCCYAPQRAKEKRMSLGLIWRMCRINGVGKLVMMGDFNEVGSENIREILNKIHQGCSITISESSVYDTPFPVSLSKIMKEDMERLILKRMVKRGCVDCGVDKSRVRWRDLDSKVVFRSPGGVHLVNGSLRWRWLRTRLLTWDVYLKTPFTYLGTKVGGNMSRKQAWKEVVDKVLSRLSRWKMKLLSIGGRLTLLKNLIRSISDGVRLLDMIVHEVRVLQGRGINVADYIRLKLENGENTRFWVDKWYEGDVIKELFPRMFALELNSMISRMTTLVPCEDRYVWTLESDGVFSVASIRKEIDGNQFQDVSRFATSGWILTSICLSFCNADVEIDTPYFLSMRCSEDRLLSKISSWWNIDYSDVNSYEEWRVGWFLIRFNPISRLLG